MAHPYRGRTQPPGAPASSRVDAEELVVHVGLALIGLLGIAIGVSCARPMELVRGSVMALLALRFFAKR